MVFKHLQAFSFALKGRKINKKSTDAQKSNRAITNTDKNISLMFVNVVPLVPRTEMHKIHPITTLSHDNARMWPGNFSVAFFYNYRKFVSAIVEKALHYS